MIGGMFKLKPAANSADLADVVTRIQSTGSDETVRPGTTYGTSVFKDARIIEDVAIGTGDTPVMHGLGRAITGWIVVRTDVATLFYEGSDSPSPEYYFHMRATAPATATLVVF